MRPSFDQIFLQICDIIAQRSTCDRRHVGAVITIDNRIVATGYNGSIPGESHCSDSLEFYQCSRCNKKFETPWFAKEGGPALCPEILCRGNAIKKQGGHIMIEGHCVRTVHAELNALLQCAHMGIQLRGAKAKLYCNTIPCIACTRAIITAGIHNIYYSGIYRPSPEVERLAKELGYVNLIYMPLEKGEEGK